MSSAGQAIGGVVGAVVGFFTPVGPLYGAQIGMMVGGYLDPPKGPDLKGPRLSDLSVQTSTYGAVIPRVYGTVALNGNIFWLENNRLKEVKTKKKSSGGKGGGSKSTTTTYAYYATFAVGLCQGEIAGVRRIWAGPKLIYDAGSSDLATIAASNAAARGFRIYTGSETQLPDARMQATLGAANTPAYRGLAYIVFDDFPLKDHGNSLMGAPIKVEVARAMGIATTAVGGTLPASDYWAAIAASDDRVVAISGYTLNSTRAAVTVDGANWTATTISDHGARYGMAYGNGVFVTIDSNAGNHVSSDGITWAWVDNKSTNPAGLPTTSYSWESVAFGGGKFVALTANGGICAATGDGYAWTAGTMSSRQWNDVAWNGSVFCAVSTSGFCATSPDGLVWTDHAMPSNSAWYGIAWNGSVFCAVIYGGSGPCATSPDGVTWTSHSMVFGGNLRAIAWNGQYFMVLDFGGGAAQYSADGITWASLAMPAAANWIALTVQSGVFYAVANNSALVARIGIYRTTADATLGAVVSAECLSSGLLTAGDIDVTGLTDAVRGYRVGTVGALRSAIEPLQGAFPFDAVQAGYKIKFKPRGGAAVAAIAPTDLDARHGDSPGIRLTINREMDSQLPRRVTVQHLDAAREYDTGEQYAERLNTAAINVKSMDLPIVLSAAEAAAVAENLLYLYWLERYDAQFSLPPTYLGLEPADIVTLADTTGNYEFRLTSVNYTAEGKIECRAKYNASAIYTPAAVGEEGGAPSSSISRAGPTAYALLDIPLLADAYDTPGFSLAMGGYFDAWPGGVLYRSDDGGASFSTAATAYPPGSVIGYCTNAFGAHSGLMVDSASALAVRLNSGSLESVTELAMFGGANHFACGADGRWEICAARTCTLQGDGSWILTDWLRGRFGTEWATGLHAVGDAIVALDSGDLQFLAVNSSTIGMTRTYRGVTDGKDLDSAGNTAFTYRGVNLKPLAPVYLNGNRNPSTNDWALDWIRRSRIGGEWRDLVDVPLGEASEAYEIEVWTSGYSTLKRTLTASTPAVAYTSAQQVTDFGSNQATLYLKLYQLSATVGRGTALTVSVTR